MDNSNKTTGSQQKPSDKQLSPEEIKEKIKTASSQKNDIEICNLFEQLATSSELSCREHKQWGEALFKLDRYKDAANNLKAAAQGLDKQRETAGLTEDEASYAASLYLVLGRSLAKLDNHGEADESYATADDYEQKNINILLKWGETLIQLTDYERAELKYSEAEKSYPNDGRVYLGWGNLHLRKKAYKEANKSFDLSIQKFNAIDSGVSSRNPKEISAYCGWGISLYYQKKYKQSLQKFEQSRKIYETHVDNKSNKKRNSIPFPFPYINLASVFFELHNYPKAWDNINKSIFTYKRDVGDPRVIKGKRFFTEFASVQKDFLNNLDEAKKCLEEALILAPESVTTLIMLVELYLQLRDEVVDHYGVLQTSKEVEDISWYSKQESHIQNILTSARISMHSPYGMHHSQAREWYRQAQAILVDKEKTATTDQEKAKILNQLGSLALAIEEIEDAQEYLTAALSIDPDSEKTHAQLGVAYTKKSQMSDEDYIAAAEHFEKSLRKKANDLNVRSNLAETYLKTKRLSKAEAEYKRILLISPGHIDSLIGLGEVYVGMGEDGAADFYEQAILHFNRGISLAAAKMGSKLLSKKELTEIMYLRAYAKTKLYDTSKVIKNMALLNDAKRDFTQCIQRSPGNYKARKAQKKIVEKQRRTAIYWVARWFGSGTIFVVSALILGVSQVKYFSSEPTTPESSVSSEEITSLIASISTDTATPEEISALVEAVIAINTEDSGTAEDSGTTERTDERTDEGNIQTTETTAESSDNAEAEIVEPATAEQASDTATENDGKQDSLTQHAGFTFGLLTFMVIGLCLPQLLKLKVGGIELEKSSVDQINTSRKLNLNR